MTCGSGDAVFRRALSSCFRGVGTHPSGTDSDASDTTTEASAPRASPGDRKAATNAHGSLLAPTTLSKRLCSDLSTSMAPPSTLRGKETLSPLKNGVHKSSPLAASGNARPVSTPPLAIVRTGSKTDSVKRDRSSTGTSLQDLSLRHTESGASQLSMSSLTSNGSGATVGSSQLHAHDKIRNWRDALARAPQLTQRLVDLAGFDVGAVMLEDDDSVAAIVEQYKVQAASTVAGQYTTIVHFESDEIDQANAAALSFVEGEGVLEAIPSMYSSGMAGLHVSTATLQAGRSGGGAAFSPMRPRSPAFASREEEADVAARPNITGSAFEESNPSPWSPVVVGMIVKGLPAVEFGTISRGLFSIGTRPSTSSLSLNESTRNTDPFGEVTFRTCVRNVTGGFIHHNIDVRH